MKSKAQLRHLLQELPVEEQLALAREIWERAGLKRENEGKPGGAQALLEIAGIGRSGVSNLGRRHDEYLADDFEG